eukprot:3633136-Amphidinium_carterae.1
MHVVLDSSFVPITCGTAALTHACKRDVIFPLTMLCKSDAQGPFQYLNAADETMIGTKCERGHHMQSSKTWQLSSGH